MKYDFTSIIDRHGKDAIAVDGLGSGEAPGLPKEGFDVIPMWVADMNFPTVPSIQEAVIERVKHPAFGYFVPSEEYFDSIIRCCYISRRILDLPSPSKTTVTRSFTVIW